MSVKILNLLPVTGDVLTPEMFKYMCKYLESDTEVQTYQITSGPPSIECEYDEALAAPDVLRLVKQGEEDGFQAIFINCFGDPAVRQHASLWTFLFLAASSRQHTLHWDLPIIFPS